MARGGASMAASSEVLLSEASTTAHAEAASGDGRHPHPNGANVAESPNAQAVRADGGAGAGAAAAEQETEGMDAAHTYSDALTAFDSVAEADPAEGAADPADCWA